MLAQKVSSSAKVSKSTSSCKAFNAPQVQLRESNPKVDQQVKHCRSMGGRRLTTSRDSGTPIDPLNMWVLDKSSPAWLPIRDTQSWTKATASSLTPYLMSMHHRALIEQQDSKVLRESFGLMRLLWSVSSPACASPRPEVVHDLCLKM